MFSLNFGKIYTIHISSMVEIFLLEVTPDLFRLRIFIGGPVRPSVPSHFETSNMDVLGLKSYQVSLTMIG